MNEATKGTEGVSAEAGGKVERWTLERDGDRPVRFRGELLGEGECGTGGTSGCRCDWTRGVKVRIFRVAGGGYVFARLRWSRWQGEDDRAEAVVCPTPAAVVEALRDYGGRIWRAEMEALAAAAERDEGVRGVAVEEIGEGRAG